jgi:hypothetical protein
MPWGALSGLTADRHSTNILYTVHDHNLPGVHIWRIDTSGNHASLSRHLSVRNKHGTPDYDPEGITVRDEGGFWLASEGKPGRGLPNLIVRIDAAGRVQQEIPLPPAVARYRVKAGFEGIAGIGSGYNERVAVIFQRRWKDDPKGQVKIGQYWPARDQWRFYRYTLDKHKGTGLSAIAFRNDGTATVLERDNKPFFKAKFKNLYRVQLPDSPDSSSPSDYALLKKFRVINILQHYPLPCGSNGKLEGLAISSDGKAYMIADDDGDGDVNLLSAGY